MVFLLLGVVSLTLLAAVSAIWRRFIHLERQAIGRIRELTDEIGEMARRRPRIELDPQDRQQLASSWGAVMCQACGLAHPGECPRVSERVSTVRFDGRNLAEETTRVSYWPNGQWEPPEGAVSSADVWGSPVPVPPKPDSEEAPG